MSALLDDRFCGHCGDRLPQFGGKLGYCSPCARRYRRAVDSRTEAQKFTADWRRMPKDPLAATVLGVLLPGGGQLYNGHFIKAGLIFVTSPLVIPWVIGVADAFFSARRINSERMSEQRAFADLKQAA